MRLSDSHVSQIITGLFGLANLLIGVALSQILGKRNDRRRLRKQLKAIQSPCLKRKMRTLFSARCVARKNFSGKIATCSMTPVTERSMMRGSKTWIKRRD